MTRVFRTSIVFLLFALTLIGGQGTVSASEGELRANEADLRAAILRQILLYTTWIRPIENGLEICVMGEGENGKAIANLSQIKAPVSSSIHVKQLSRTDTAETCPVVVVNTEYSKELSPPSSSLVVCNACEKYQQLAAITLVKVDSQIRYSVNLTRLSNSAARLRSDVLKWAQSVEGEMN